MKITNLLISIIFLLILFLSFSTFSYAEDKKNDEPEYSLLVSLASGYEFFIKTEEGGADYNANTVPCILGLGFVRTTKYSTLYIVLESELSYFNRIERAHRELDKDQIRILNSKTYLSFIYEVEASFWNQFYLAAGIITGLNYQRYEEKMTPYTKFNKVLTGAEVGILIQAKKVIVDQYLTFDMSFKALKAAVPHIEYSYDDYDHIASSYITEIFITGLFSNIYSDYYLGIYHHVSLTYPYTNSSDEDIVNEIDVKILLKVWTFFNMKKQVILILIFLVTLLTQCAETTDCIEINNEYFTSKYATIYYDYSINSLVQTNKEDIKNLIDESYETAKANIDIDYLPYILVELRTYVSSYYAVAEPGIDVITIYDIKNYLSDFEYYKLYLKETLVHEMIHLITWNIYGEPDLTFLSEGVAEAYSESYIDWSALSYIRSNSYSTEYIKELLGYSQSSFYKNQYENYKIAGSFVLYLINNYGKKLFFQFFKEADTYNYESKFAEIYTKELSFVISDWIAYLDSL